MARHKSSNLRHDDAIVFGENLHVNMNQTVKYIASSFIVNDDKMCEVKSILVACASVSAFDFCIIIGRKGSKNCEHIVDNVIHYTISTDDDF